MTLSCMGGWSCLKRDTCACHLFTTGKPVERLCEAGQFNAYTPIQIVKKP